MINSDCEMNASQKNFIRLNSVQGEVDSRTVKIHIVQSQNDKCLSGELNIEKEPVDLTGCSVRLYCIKPDNCQVFCDGTITDAASGIVLFSLPYQVTAFPGTVEGHLVITKPDGTTLKITGFQILVEKADEENALESTNEFSALITALNKADAATGKAAKAAAAVQSLDTKIGEETDRAKTAENLKADKTETAVLSSRMDAFTSLQTGSTTGDAELADARIGADGVSYRNAGSAVREQILPITDTLFSAGQTYSYDHSFSYTHNDIGWTANGKEPASCDGLIKTVKVITNPYFNQQDFAASKVEFALLSLSEDGTVKSFEKVCSFDAKPKTETVYLTNIPIKSGQILLVKGIGFQPSSTQGSYYWAKNWPADASSDDPVAGHTITTYKLEAPIEFKIAQNNLDKKIDQPSCSGTAGQMLSLNSEGNTVWSDVLSETLKKQFSAILLPMEKKQLKLPDVLHILVYGQSLSMGYNTGSVLPGIELENALMFKHARTKDFGYTYGISYADYEANQEKYDSDFYGNVQMLKEESGYGNPAAEWSPDCGNEFETPCSGVAYGLYKAFVESGFSNLPCKILLSAPGKGNEAIPGIFTEGGTAYERFLKDVAYAKKYCDRNGLSYRVGAVMWLQGEKSANLNGTVNAYQSELSDLIDLYNTKVKEITGQKQDIAWITYQTGAYFGGGRQNTAVAQFELANQGKCFLSAPCYPLAHAGKSDWHLTNISSRLIGNYMGRIYKRILDGNYSIFKPYSATVNPDNSITILFNRDIVLDGDGLRNEGLHKSEIAQNAGFFAKDADENVVSTRTVQNDNRTVTVQCSAKPVSLTYGYKSLDDLQAGGFVREKTQYDGYAKNPLFMYMPVQPISLS